MAKKLYAVSCTVNHDASSNETVTVRTTKPDLACKKAEAILRDKGFSGVFAYSCKEV